MMNENAIRTALQKLWRGDIPLLQTFWLYYVTALIVVEAVGAMAGGLGGVFEIAALAWSGFMVRPIMMAADKYTGPEHWALGAKIFAALIVVAIVVRLTAF
jgi:hypothetical protein